MLNARRTSRDNAAHVPRGSDELRLDGVVHNLRNIHQDPYAGAQLAKAGEDLALELE